jgi:MFS_1 like family
MQSIGITVEEIAIIYLALPFTTFLAPPLTGNEASAGWRRTQFDVSDARVGVKRVRLRQLI